MLSLNSCLCDVSYNIQALAPQQAGKAAPECAELLGISAGIQKATLDNRSKAHVSYRIRALWFKSSMKGHPVTLKPVHFNLCRH